MALYQSIAEHYADDIASGRLRAGTRLPALRRLASTHGISLTTAIKAYETLEQGGWIVAQAQSGFFVAERTPSAAPPLSPVFQAQSRDPGHCAPAGGYNPNAAFFSPLGTSMLAPSLLPQARLATSLKRAAKLTGDALLRYPEPQGNLNLRAALADHFRRYDFLFAPQHLVVTHGCLHAVRLAIHCISEPGDALAVSSPCFSGLLELVSDMSRKIVEIPLTEDGLDLDQLETLMRAGAIRGGLFSTSHMNPSGSSLSAQQKQRLASLAAQYQTPIIEDDVYLELGYQKKPPLPAKHWDKDGWILWCGSASKTLAAGMRLGWCLPGRALTQYIQTHKSTSYGVNTVMQLGLADFINSGQYLSHLNTLRPQLQQQARRYQRLLAERLPGSARISQPSGGLVLWVQIPGLNTERLAELAAQEFIDVRSGSGFTSLHYYRDCFRINMGWPLVENGDASMPSSRPREDIHHPSRTFDELVRVCELTSQLVTA